MGIVTVPLAKPVVFRCRDRGILGISFECVVHTKEIPTRQAESKRFRPHFLPVQAHTVISIGRGHKLRVMAENNLLKAHSRGIKVCYVWQGTIRFVRQQPERYGADPHE